MFIFFHHGFSGDNNSIESILLKKEFHFMKKRGTETEDSINILNIIFIISMPIGD